VSSKPKTQACQEILKRSKFNTAIFEGDYSNFVSKNGIVSSPPDFILCLANENNIWPTIQNNLPSLVFHATTTMNWGCNFGRHIPKKEWCIMCRFSPELKGSHKPPCSEAVIPSPQFDSQRSEQHIGVLPFLSTISSVLLLAEMAKMSLSEYPINENFVTFSSRGDGRFSKFSKKPKMNCICRSQVLENYPSSIKNTKFWKLVETTI
jgi:hypothetical protein